MESLCEKAVERVVNRLSTVFLQIDSISLYPV